MVGIYMRAELKSVIAPEPVFETWNMKENEF